MRTPHTPSNSNSPPPRGRSGGWMLAPSGIALAVLAATADAPPASPTSSPPSPSPWSLSASLALREDYDDNVFLQDLTDQAGRSSFVTTALPSIGVQYSDPHGLKASATYAPEISFFHSEPGEDFVLHRFNGGASSPLGSATWDFQGSVVAINGGDLGPTFTGPGGATAAGGPRIRDRRDATAYRGSWKLTQPFGRWLVRPAATAYLHDFHTRHLRNPGYVNFVDRSEFTAGLDLGTAAGPKARAFLGYRHGWQDQHQLLDYPEESDNTFHRILASYEGNPWPWLKAGVTLGPEFRHYGDHVAAGFGSRHELNLYVDASLAFTLTPSHTVTAGMKLFEQPGFLGRAAYEDLTYDLAWRWKLGTRDTLVLSSRAYNTDFHVPVVRNDWVLSGGAALAHTFTPHLQGEVSFTRENGISLVSDTDGREYTRNVVTLGLRYVFR